MIVLACLLGAGLLLLFWIEYVEPRLFFLNYHEIKIQKPLNASLRILHLTDTHFASPEAFLYRFFDRLARESYDLVLLSGDIFDCDAGVPVGLHCLKKLKPRIGIFAVFGNHDYYNYQLHDGMFHNFPGQTFPGGRNQVDSMQTELEKIGICVLRNETKEIKFHGSRILLHGLDDPTTLHQDLDYLKRSLDPACPNLLLTHSINVFSELKDGDIDAAFAGHSHGGQLRLPFYGAVIAHNAFGRKYASGVTKLRGAVCSVPRGLAASRFLKARFLCPPEAKSLTLRGIPSGKV